MPVDAESGPACPQFLLAAVLLGLVCFAPRVATGAAFGLDFEGARAVGMATAGSASGQDASTIFYNPAGLGFLERNEVMGGGQLFLLHDVFKNDGSNSRRPAAHAGHKRK